MKCDFCGKEESLPFICNYCSGTFCSDHRLPESHACKGDLSHKPVAPTSTSTFSWSSSAYGGNVATRKSVFSPKEIRDILIAWVALSIAFFVANRGFLNPGTMIITFGASLVAVGTGFVVHELMHKFTAQRYGYWAEFRMWLFGLVFALLTSFGGFIFAAPGATYVQGYNVPDRENALISLAGPAINIAIAVGFLLLLLVGNAPLIYIGLVGFQVNLFLAAFNMIPIFPLDGSKVFRWKKAYWAIVFVPLVIAVVAVFYIFSGFGL